MTMMLKILLTSGIFAGALLSLDKTSEKSPPLLGNVCNLEFYYCPRDPGCIGYVFSVANVTVYDHASSKAIDAKDIVPGSAVTVTVVGSTELDHIPDDANYKIYDMAGHNAAAGVLSNVAQLDGKGNFRIGIDFKFPAESISDGDVEFGIDVFMDKSADEGFCVEVANQKYVKEVSAKVSPKFEEYCEDEGHGHFILKNVTVVPRPVPSVDCGSSGPGCVLKWYYCPRDPGCVDYQFSVKSVEVDVADKDAVRAGDKITLIVKGVTGIKHVPVEATYKIYDMAGHNAGGGLLSDVLCLDGDDDGFTLEATLDLPAASVSGDLLEFGLDVFMDQSAHEGMCVEVASPAYVDSIKDKLPHFELLCEDHGDGTFSKRVHPEEVHDAVCVLSGIYA